MESIKTRTNLSLIEKEINPLQFATSEMEAKLKALVFKPEHKCLSGGDQLQICTTTYNNVNIYWFTKFYWNIFKAPLNIITVDLLLPINTVLKDGRMEEGYCADGFGYPEFNTLEKAINFIDTFNNLK
jgi:hypothetical protein